MTNTNDSGYGSLRAEVAAAQSGDTIVFAPKLDGKTITLTSGPIADTGTSLQILGPGAALLTVSGNNQSGIFNLQPTDVNQPPFAVSIFEKIAFHSAHFAAFLEWRVSGGREAISGAQHNVLDPEMHLTPGPFLATPGLWLGLAFAALFLIAAARVRRQRAPL